MGKLVGGPFYILRGRTGSNVGRYLKGQNILSMRPIKSSKPATKKQLDQQHVFAMMTAFLAPLRDIVNLGFRTNRRSQSAMNAAVAYNLKYAISSGVVPEVTIDYKELRFNRGTLAAASMPKAEAAAGKVNFSWQNVFVNNGGQSSDKAVFVVLDTLTHNYVTAPLTVLRSQLTYGVLVPPELTGSNCACYLSFISADDKKVSDTQYLGTVKII